MTESERHNLWHRLRGIVAGEGLRARLLRGGAGSAVIQAGNRLLALALGIVLARALGPEGYGIYAYAFAIMSLLMVAAEAGVPTLLMREVAASHGQERWGLLRGTLRRAGQFVLATSLSVSLVGLLVLWSVADRLSPAELYTTLLMLAVLPLAAQAKTLAHAMRGLHRVAAGQAVELLVRPLLVLAAVAVLFSLSPGWRTPQYAMAAQLGAVAVTVLAGWWVLRYQLPAETASRPPEYRTRQWLKSALPFTLIGGAGIINSQADILMIGWFLSSDQVGIYRVAVQGSLLVVFLMQAASAVLGPHFSGLYANGEIVRLQRLYWKSTVFLVAASAPVAFLLVMFGRELVSFIFGTGFGMAALPLAILSIGYLLNMLCGPVGLLLQMTGREATTAKYLWVSALLNVALNLGLIPAFGVNGAAFATGFTVVFYHVVLRYQAWRELGF